MRKLLPLILIIGLAIISTACGVDPFQAEQIKEQGKADALRLETQQIVDGQKEQLRHQTEINTIDELKARQRYEAIAAAWQNAKPMLIAAVQVWVIFLASGGIVAILYLSQHTVVEGKRLLTAYVDAKSVAMEVKARQIKIDPETGQFPALYMGHGKIAVGDLNTGHVMTFDTRNDGVPQMIALAGAIRHTGVATRNTARANKANADSVPLAAQPPIIDGSFIIDEELLDGTFGDFFRAMKNKKESQHATRK